MMDTFVISDIPFNKYFLWFLIYRSELTPLLNESHDRSTLNKKRECKFTL